VKDSFHTIIYATVLGTVCALLLTGAAKFTEPYRKSNAHAQEIRSVLAVLGIPFSPQSSSGELVKVFEKNIQKVQRRQLTMYVYSPTNDQENVRAVAIAFAGDGLWGPIKGFLSLEPDMKVIRNIVFHEQQETPGLGGDIASAGFCNQFTGKSIRDEKGNPGIYIVRDGASAINEVDAISGATMTCDKVQTMLNTTIARIVKEP